MLRIQTKSPPLFEQGLPHNPRPANRYAGDYLILDRASEPFPPRDHWVDRARPTEPPLSYNDPGVNIDYFQRGLWRIDLGLAWHYALGRAFRISMCERTRGDAAGPVGGFAYGETSLAAMRRILTLAEACATDTFLDLGSGTGRFLLIAARLYDLEGTGVELLPTFVRNAQRIATRHAPRCRFVQADLFSVDWSGASLLYSNTTAFTDEGMARFSEKCGEIRPGARLVTVTRQPEHPDLIQVAYEMLEFSWGLSSVFVYRRR